MSAAFRAALAADRDLFNQKFAEARRRRPDLDPDAFSDFLRGAAAGVVESAAAQNPDRTHDVAHAVYDAALTLVSEKLAGPGGRHAEIDRLWSSLLPKLAALVADQPARVIGSLTNAVFNLCTTPGARAADFRARLASVAALLPSVDDLLAAGQVAAWRAGLAHLRPMALAAGDALSARVTAALLGAPRLDWSAARTRLEADPWWDPAATSELSRPSVVASVGAFRGFGGLFVAPPCVAAVDGELLVAAGAECWHLAADAFGATFHRADPALLAHAAKPPDCVPLPLPAIGAVTSVAAARGTLAVTGSLTHALTLIALAE
jgi:hypothetical protein